jgi:hypothetical protein
MFAAFQRHGHSLAIAGALTVLVATATASAHEIGTTHVEVLVQDADRYSIEVVTDAAALLDKLEAVASEHTEDRRSAARIHASFARLDPIFRTRLHLRIDDAEVVPAIEYRISEPVDATSPAIATIRLSGPIPHGARAVTWAYAWTFASYALTFRNGTESTVATQWLDGGQTSAPLVIAAAVRPQSRAATAWRYLQLGFTHIVPYGFDHVLFVLGIFLLGGGTRSTFWQVSAFTVAHSITLGLSMFGVISASPALVEPLIAVSIAYVAIENVVLRELRAWRVVLVFAFGLLHGLGFAGALKELGLPRSEFLTALVTFNLGVEAGQLTVIGTAFLLVGWHCGHRDWYRRRVVVPASLLIACTAVYWTIERL